MRTAQRVNESVLLVMERTFADAGFTKTRSEYVGLLYRATWECGSTAIRIYQVEPGTQTNHGSNIFEVW